jgi:DNA-binding response OmpR family regulator
MVSEQKMKNRITVIEDDPDLRQLVTLVLKTAGYDVISKSDGANLFPTNGDATDLYLIDCNLGAISGLDLCRKIKDEVDNEARVIIVSANPDLRALAMDACADDALPKPFNTKELLRKISEYLPI